MTRARHYDALYSQNNARPTARCGENCMDIAAEEAIKAIPFHKALQIVYALRSI
jgi:hypothetical protein